MQDNYEFKNYFQSKYILCGRRVVPIDTSCPSGFMEWGLFFETEGARIVKQTQVSDSIRVSTVFLGVDFDPFGYPKEIRFLKKKRWMGGTCYHRRIQKKWFKQDSQKYRPLVFETMVFRDGSSAECERGRSWEQAERIHAHMVRMIELELQQNGTS